VLYPEIISLFVFSYDSYISVTDDPILYCNFKLVLSYSHTIE